MTILFGATSSVEDVLQGQDLHKSRVLITGVTAGVGLETVRALANHGAEIVGAARDIRKARTAFEEAGIDASSRGHVRLEQLDLASLANVRACADALVERGDTFDVVIANAGVMAVPEGRTVDGFETQFATNYLGHFLLVNRIAKLMGADGRLVMVSSAGHRGADVDLDDINFERSAYDPLVAYRRSKTAIISFAVEFDRRHRAKGVRATAIHPGAVLTNTARELVKSSPAAASSFTWKTVSQGAATSIWAGFIAAADKVGAQYCEDCHIGEVMDDPSAAYGVRSYALDPIKARALWFESEQMVGETF